MLKRQRPSPFLCQPLEARTLFAAITADLLADTDRNGVIDARDQAKEDGYNTTVAGGRGAIVLPNVDRDNTTTNAPDNWTGGQFNGRAVPPNNVIDNAADLADVARVRMAKLDTDVAYAYRVVVRLLLPKSDPAWFKGVAATDRVRVFLPSKTAGADTVSQAGDVAVMGPGLGDTLVFTNDPAAPNEYPITDLAGTGGFYFGVEGLRSGANVRLEMTLQSAPIGTDGPPPPPETIGTDAVELKVAPFVLNDNRRRVTKAIVDDLTPYGLDNSALQRTLKGVFGDKLVTAHTGDLWQQDGYEIGYAEAPYGAMPVVLELPRARDVYFNPDANMRSFVRGTLLAPGVGVSTDLASLPNEGSSSFGGDIESIAKPGQKGPGYLLASGMPTAMKSYFAAQGVNELIDLPLDWLSVNHVDEVVQMTPGGKAIVADPDTAWALLLWAKQLDPNVRLHAGMNGNESLPDNPTGDVKAAVLLADARLRDQNLTYAQRDNALGGVVRTLKAKLGLTEAVTAPARTAGTGTGNLSRGGMFSALLGERARELSVRFTSTTDYTLRYRDAGGAWSAWTKARRTSDTVFPTARAFLMRTYFHGNFKAGDAFTFKTVPGASLVRMPVLFASPGLQFDPSTPFDPQLTPFSEDHVNALVDGTTVVTGRAYGPKVKWNGTVAGDLFQDYATAAFGQAGYTKVVYTDARVYHNSSGSVHCATNAVRAVPDDAWWSTLR